MRILLLPRGGDAGARGIPRPGSYLMLEGSYLKNSVVISYRGLLSHMRACPRVGL